MTLLKYPKYKDSGLSWVGQIPEHWQSIPLYACSKVKKITGDTNRELLSVYLNKGVIKFSEVTDKRTNVTSEDLTKYQSVDPGDFVLNNQQAWRGSVGVSKYNGIVSPAYLVLQLDSNIYSEFANKLFRDSSMVTQYLINSKGVGTIQRNLYWPHLKRALTFFPPKDEQILISRYLNHINNKIQKYISAKRKLIKLLEEEKHTIIHQAVTGAIDVRTGFPFKKYKPTGLEWIPEIPQEWDVKKLRYLFRFKKGKRAAELTTEYISNNSGAFPVYSGQTDGNGVMGNINWFEFDTENSSVIFVSTVGARAMTTRLLKGKFNLSQNCALIIPLKPNLINIEYYNYILSRLFEYEKASISLIMQPSLRFSDLNKFIVPEPDKTYQDLSVKYLNKIITNIEKSTKIYTNQISYTKEYRNRLIADVVTGKIDVRKIASTLPDEIEEVEEIDSSDEHIVEDEVEIDENESN